MNKIMNVYQKLSDSTKKLSKIDYIIMGIMVLIYGIISFYHLGDMKSPQTFYEAQNVGDTISVNLTDESYVKRMVYWTGRELGAFTIMGSSDGINYNEITSIAINDVFSWKEVELNSKFSSLKFVANRENSCIGDIILYDELDNKIEIVYDKNNPLADETGFNVKKSTYLNSTYFDEIYFSRSAYEYIHGLNIYEWTHPPLGKLIMTIPIMLFGYSPFTTRLMSNIAGILIIPAMYVLCKKIFSNRKYALLGGLLMMFDTFHFAHTRIALVDSFEILFIILSVIFMKNYLDLKKNDLFKKKAINLLLSGFFIGCAVTTKWNAGYVAFGLAIVFFYHLAREYNFNLIKYFKENFNINIVYKYGISLVLAPIMLYYLSFLLFSKNIAHTSLLIYLTIIFFYLIISFILFLRKDRYLLKLFFTCVVSFLLIPIIIYALSFFLFPYFGYDCRTLTGIIDQSKAMFDYHANLVATHPFSSPWYSWPIMYKPVWFYASETINNMRMTIVDIGNPFIWWFGIPSIIYLIISTIKKNKTSLFILIFFLASFIPYVFIGRIMFLYHYFITLPFVMLGIVAFIKWITEKTKNNKVYILYTSFVVLGFIVFYPIVSGMMISDEYINALKWLSSWIF